MKERNQSMRVDILGRGIIPGLGSNAPVYNKDMSEREIERVLKYASLRVYLAGTRVAVIRRNLHELIMLDNSPKKTSPQTKKKSIPEKVETVEAETIVQETPIEVEETTEEATETEQPMTEETADASKTEEAPATTQNNNSKKKKNRK